MIQQRTFWTEPPTHVRVYPCPACQETISVDAPSCRFCRAATDVKVANQLWVQNQQITSAVSRANAFRAFSRSAILLTGFSLWILTVSGGLAEIWVVFNLLALSYGAQWLNHNSSLVTNDADYAKAVRKVKQAMVAWALALFLQVAIYLILYGSPDWETIFLVE
jgi:hypothetical protein